MALTGSGGVIAERIKRVRIQIREACQNAGRDPGTVRLIAASKGQPAEAIRAAYDCGQRDFGENFAQELKDKAAALADLTDLRWHFIGRFQSNKSNLLVRTGAWVQSVSAVSHLEALAKRHLRRPVPCMVQVRFDDDSARGGAAPSDLSALVYAAAELDGVDLRGLMLVPPQEDDPSATLAHFARLRALADKYDLPERSMGMSGDFELAIAESSTMVRIGTAVFGPRRKVLAN